MSTMTPARPGRGPKRRPIAGERRRPDTATAAVGETTETEAGAPPPAPARPPVSAPEPPRRGSWLWFGVAAVLALALVTTALVLGLVTWDYRQVRSHERVQAAQQEASAAAERAAAEILSFGHATLDDDLAAATKLMTPEFAEEFTGTYESVAGPTATDTQATVTAEVLATAVVHASEHRAEILVYVDQTTTSTAHPEPRVALNRTTFDMVEVDGEWLVADFASY